MFGIFVVMLVCGKAFRKERRDIGIYKATGMSTFALRLSFALRYAIIATVGGILGMVLSYFFSEKVMSFVLTYIGMTRVSLDFSVRGMVIPVLLVAVIFFAFSYIASRKVKRVDVRELISE